jgi:hypothetical protein
MMLECRRTMQLVARSFQALYNHHLQADRQFLQPHTAQSHAFYVDT